MQNFTSVSLESLFQSARARARELRVRELESQRVKAKTLDLGARAKTLEQGARARQLSIRFLSVFNPFAIPSLSYPFSFFSSTLSSQKCPLTAAAVVGKGFFSFTANNYIDLNSSFLSLAPPSSPCFFFHASNNMARQRRPLQSEGQDFNGLWNTLIYFIFTSI